MLLDLTRFFLAAYINATAHRCAPLFEVRDLSTEKSDADVRGRQFFEQTGERRLADARLFWD
jgi:hypothetical protein